MHWGLTLLSNILSRSFIEEVFKLTKINSIYCRYWGGMWGFKGFKGIGGYKKGYLVKIGVSFIAKMYWEGDS